ncbi:MAG: TetR/AcrR family transcriptional regulator [Cyanobacteria bacterium J06626_18]
MTTKKASNRGRPRGFDLDAAIAIAMDLFHQRGYDGVGVAELSKTIGITAPSLYAAFGSKRELFEQVLQRYAQQEGCWMPAIFMTEEPLETVIHTLFISAAEVYTRDPEHLGCLIIDGTRNCGDPQAQALTAGFRQASRQAIGDRIQSGATHLKTAQVEALANYVITVLVGLSGSARDGMTPAALHTTAEIAAAGFAQQLQQYSHERNSV